MARAFARICSYIALPRRRNVPARPATNNKIN